ncbi:MAG: monofunctional biosynthetic peptidoglycan transglycosylase [Myxococcota bacterium]
MARRLRRRIKPQRFAIGVLVWVAVSTLFGMFLGASCQVAALRHETPDVTAFQREAMERRGRVRKKWVDLDRVDPKLVRAVLVAEDSRFFQHDGFDRAEMKAALRDAATKLERLRGASTLSQQLAKNLFLSSERTLTRKAWEAGYTLLLEWLLSKRRILELYLNEAQFGPEIYGVEAGARYHFGRSPRSLTDLQAAQLAAVLPAPTRWGPESRSRRYRSKVERILSQMKKSGHLDPFLRR